MKKIKINEYVLNDPKIDKNRTIVNLSDVHSNVEVLKCIVKILEKIKVDCICIPGDTLDSIDNQYNDELGRILKKIGEISKTFLSIGNHEMYEINYQDGKKREIESKKYIDFFMELARDSNCIPLISEFSKIILDNDIVINAINVPFSYYQRKEDLEQFKKILNKEKAKIESEKFNILLSHSPNSIIQNNQIDTSIDVIKDINLILCGHNHGGLVPTFLQDIIKGHRGFVGPYLKLFQANAYGVWNKDQTSVLVSNDVTKISLSSEAGKLHSMLNRIYVPEVDLIHIEPGNEHILQLSNRTIQKI